MFQSKKSVSDIQSAVVKPFLFISANLDLLCKFETYLRGFPISGHQTYMLDIKGDTTHENSWQVSICAFLDGFLQLLASDQRLMYYLPTYMYTLYYLHVKVCFLANVLCLHVSPNKTTGLPDNVVILWRERCLATVHSAGRLTRVQRLLCRPRKTPEELTLRTLRC